MYTLNRCLNPVLLSSRPQMLAFPLLSYGRKTIRAPATINKLALTYKIVGPVVPTYAPIIGAISPQIRLTHAAIPDPVPRCTLGRISGVYAYSTPYITFWVNAVAQLNPKIAAVVRALAVKRKRKIPVNIVERLMTPFLPIRHSMINPAIIEPGIPQTCNVRNRDKDIPKR